MPAKSIPEPEIDTVFFHIYNKGIEDRIIFNDDQDYQVFLDYLKEYLTPPIATKQEFTVNGRTFHGVPHQPKNYFNRVELIAYCLMPNHFHLLLHQKAKGAIENFIRSLCTRYSIYFNKKYHRTGTLFGGRYKSALIKDSSSLRLLTRYFHQAGSYSSYPEYLGQTATPWVKTKIVLSLPQKDQASYQDFVEKYQLDPTERNLLEKIVFESESEHFDTQAPPAAANFAPNPGLSLNIPAFAAITTVFILLVTLGIRNVRVSSIQPAVLSAAIEAAPEPTVATETPKLKTLIIVTAPDPSLSINIRQAPATQSAKIGRANHGTAFEFVSEDSGWYEVRLPDNSTGFLSQEFAIKEETSN